MFGEFTVQDDVMISIPENTPPKAYPSKEEIFYALLSNLSVIISIKDFTGELSEEEKVEYARENKKPVYIVTLLQYRRIKNIE